MVEVPMAMYVRFVKRLFDLVVAALLIILLLPVGFLIYLTLLVVYKGNPIFVQVRTGRQGKLFTIFKFKTMHHKGDSEGRSLSDAERLTSIGRVLRKYSLDELPQLINVVKGEMSLVGPRPLLPEYLLLYNEEQMKRHLVKPGITGLAQVNGRNLLSWEEKFRLDTWYATHLHFTLDLKILLLTVKNFISPEGISAMNSATMEKFTGNAAT